MFVGGRKFKLVNILNNVGVTTSGAVGVSMLTTATGSSGGAVIFLLTNI